MVAFVLRDADVYWTLENCKVIQEGIILLRPVFKYVAMTFGVIGDVVFHHHIIGVVEHEASLLAVADRIGRNDRTHSRI